MIGSAKLHVIGLVLVAALLLVAPLFANELPSCVTIEADEVNVWSLDEEGEEGDDLTSLHLLQRTSFKYAGFRGGQEIDPLALRSVPEREPSTLTKHDSPRPGEQPEVRVKLRSEEDTIGISLTRLAPWLLAVLLLQYLLARIVGASDITACEAAKSSPALCALLIITLGRQQHSQRMLSNVPLNHNIEVLLLGCMAVLGCQCVAQVWHAARGTPPLQVMVQFGRTMGGVIRGGSTKNVPPAMAMVRRAVDSLSLVARFVILVLLLSSSRAPDYSDVAGLLLHADSSSPGRALIALGASLAFMFGAGLVGAGIYLVLYLVGGRVNFLAGQRLPFVVELIKWSLSSGDLLPGAFLLLRCSVQAATIGGEVASTTTAFARAAQETLACAVVLQAVVAIVYPDLCSCEMEDFGKAAPLSSGDAFGRPARMSSARMPHDGEAIALPDAVTLLLGKVLSRHTISLLSSLRWFCIVALSICIGAVLWFVQHCARPAGNLEMAAVAMLLASHFLPLLLLWGLFFLHEFHLLGDVSFEKAFGHLASVRASSAAGPVLAVLPVLALTLHRHEVEHRPVQGFNVTWAEAALWQQAWVLAMAAGQLVTTVVLLLRFAWFCRNEEGLTLPKSASTVGEPEAARSWLRETAFAAAKQHEDQSLSKAAAVAKLLPGDVIVSVLRHLPEAVAVTAAVVVLKPACMGLVVL